MSYRDGRLLQFAFANYSKHNGDMAPNPLQLPGTLLTRATGVRHFELA